MRVLFLNDLHDPRIGSSIRQMYQHAARLRELGHEAAVASTTPDPSQVGARTIEGCEVHLLHSDYPLRFRAWVGLNNRRVIGPLRELLRAWKPDVVHSQLVHTHLSYAALTEARAAGAAVVFTAHDSMTYCYQKLDCFHGGERHGWGLEDYAAYWQKCIPCQRFRYRPGRNAAIRKVLERDVDRFTVVSDALGEAVRANGIRVDRTIHNALRLKQRLPDATAVGAFRRRFGLEGKRLVAIGGRLHDLKGVNEMLRMLAHLRAEFGDLRLVVMGREEAWRGFEPRAHELGVADMVVPTGWLDGDELASAYAALDVLVSPSICFETFGMVNLEAMEMSRPVVVTSFGGCRETVREGVTGFVANPFDITGFAGRIARLLRDPQLARRMGQAGRALLEERFTIPRLADEFAEEYERALALRRGARPGP
jgi:glycosyltransferase involved in cell wall biosynthesis